MTKNDEFVILVEDLFSDLEAIYESESTFKNKKEMATQFIFDFYTKYKDQYGITLQDVENELDKLREKYGHESKEEQER